MKNFKDNNEILDFAIENEQTSIDFYTKLAKETNNRQIQELFDEFAKEEEKHKYRLTKIKEDKKVVLQEHDIIDMKISDYFVSKPKTKELSYQEALILAMKREKAAFKLYKKLSEMTEDAELKEIFLQLANEEAKHKMNFEIEYDNIIYKGN